MSDTSEDEVPTSESGEQTKSTPPSVYDKLKRGKRRGGFNWLPLIGIIVTGLVLTMALGAATGNKFVSLGGTGLVIFVAVLYIIKQNQPHE